MSTETRNVYSRIPTTLTIKEQESKGEAFREEGGTGLEKKPREAVGTLAPLKSTPGELAGRDPESYELLS